MAVPTGLVSSHIGFAFVALLGAVLLSFPNEIGLFFLIAAVCVLFVWRLAVAAWSPDLRGADLVGPAVAIGSLLLPSLLALLGSPLSVRGDEGSGALVGGLPSVAAWQTGALVVAVFLLPFCMVRAVWSCQDTPRRTVFALGCALWVVPFLVVPGLWVGDWASGPVAGRIASTSARSALVILAVGFLYALKGTPDVRSDRAASV